MVSMPMPKLVDIQEGDWTERLSLAGRPPHEHPHANLNNCLIALEHSPEWRGVLLHNEFTHQIWVQSRLPWGGEWNRAWTDADDSLAARWFQQHSIHISTGIAAEAIQSHARTRTINPLLEFINGLEWDHTPRVDRWLTDFLGVKWSDYSCAVGRAWLISAVARAIQPGCKADHCLILEGAQGIQKSTALQVLAGPELFTDDLSDNLASKEASILCVGVWIVEFSELERIFSKQSRAEIAKAFISRTEDRFRPHYARYPIRIPRQCVFAGTTNKENYLPDETGNRRFWPVKCGPKIRIDALRNEREQLWAEAAHLYHEGHPWWLDYQAEEWATKELSTRYDVDTWQGLIEQYTRRRPNTSVGEILEHCIKKNSSEWNRWDQMRVARTLTSLGWEQYREPNAGARRYRPQQWSKS